MNYCSNCGSQLDRRIPPGDDRSRYYCDDCKTIHYENPKMVVGCLPEWDGKILMCRRAIEPRHGLWTIPAGFLENGETLEEGAMRETLEEAGAEVEIESLYTITNLVHINQVYFIFRSKLLIGRFKAGDESLEVKLFDLADLPWDDVAFPSIKKTLRHYFRDRPNGVFPLYMTKIPPIDD